MRFISLVLHLITGLLFNRIIILNATFEEISSEFIVDNQQLCQTMPKSIPKKEGGPYPESQKKTRRDEVFKLHFDYGYSARKIADMMKINRNTINSDIAIGYSQLQKQDDTISVDDWLNKLLYRLEAQRSRLAENLDKKTGLILLARKWMQQQINILEYSN